MAFAGLLPSPENQRSQPGSEFQERRQAAAVQIHHLRNPDCGAVFPANASASMRGSKARKSPVNPETRVLAPGASICTLTLNLPDWEPPPAGFHRMFAALFHHTPPPALLIDDVALIMATQQFLAGRDLHVPKRVSLVCIDHNDSFDWCQSEIAHMRWNSQALVRRAVQWANGVGRWRADLKQTLFPADFVRGGTIGPESRPGQDG